MRKLILVALLFTNALHAEYKPAMRNNFGAASALFRFQTAYFYTSPVIKNTGDGLQTQTTPNSMLNSMRSSLEAMVMLNNRFHFTESVYKTAPRFLQVKLNHDGAESKLYSSVSITQGLPCMTSIPIFGQVKGYWGVGAVYMHQTGSNEAQADIGKSVGVRTGLNCYNPRSALQSEVIGFKDRVVVNVIAYRKLGEHILVQAGSEYNSPLAGFSILAGSCRFSVNTRLYKKQLQHGISFTGNL